jgi:hypothetical protein
MQPVLALCGVLALSACAAHYAQIPPRLDLQPYGRVALVTFSAEQANGSLTTLATQRFAEALLRSQSGIEVMELGTADSSLRKMPAGADPSAVAQALGREKGVPAVFLGHLKMSNVKPSARLSGPANLNVKASVAAELTVQLLSTRTGGTLWRSSAATSRTVGRVALADGLPSVAVRDPDNAYDQMLGELAANVTRDLRPTWVKQ